MSNIKFIILTAIALMIASCTKSPASTYAPPELEGDWSVKMTLSGGIAGLLRNIEVKSDGSYTVTDERANNTVEGELKKEELAKLEEMISTLEFSTTKTQSICADCFVYDIEILSGGTKMLVNVDDLTLEDSGMGTLVQFLHKIMDSALK